MVYIVLGMHKSGTTLVSKILHESGINMGDFDENIPYDRGNKYERLETMHSNYDLMKSEYNQFSLSVLKVVTDFSMIPGEVIKNIKSLINKLEARYNEWGFKDPKTCLTYEIWKKFIPDHKLIIVFRDPVELWLHYKPKAFINKVNSPLICWKVIKAWYIYNNQILQQLKNGNEIKKIVFEYNDFLNNDAFFQELEKFITKPLNDCRDKNLYRNKKKLSILFRIVAFLQKSISSRDVNNLYNQLKSYKLNN
jgi:hypothetical protein